MSKPNINNEIPCIGDKIYVPTDLYVYRGEDDFHGGVATISKIEYSKNLPIYHFNYVMIGIKERSNTMYNYRYLLSIQNDLKKEYKNQVAYAIPDSRTEFNYSCNSDWRC